MRIIPAIDIIDGKCVRLTQGDYDQQTTYESNPVDVAQAFEDMGFEYLHVVDLDGAKSGKPQNLQVLKQICSQTSLKVDFGGGIRSEDQLYTVFDCGVQQVNVGSFAVKNPAAFVGWLSKFGGERLILSADVRERNIAISGWQENSNFSLLPFVTQMVDQGLKYLVCTDIAKDGMLLGPSVDLYSELTLAFEGLKVVASGGVANQSDIENLVETGVDGVIIGKAIYEKTIDPKKLLNNVG